jgi:hypothetical protein
VSNALRADGGISSTLKQARGSARTAIRWSGKAFFWRGDSDMGAKVETKAKTIVETIVLILGIGMVAPLPFEELVGGYGRLALAVLGFLLIFWWLFNNDRKKDLRGEL